ncbi:26197_t:CDS:2, partial [Racocetra persica]
DLAKLIFKSLCWKDFGSFINNLFDNPKVLIFYKDKSTALIILYHYGSRRALVNISIVLTTQTFRDLTASQELVIQVTKQEEVYLIIKVEFKNIKFAKKDYTLPLETIDQFKFDLIYIIGSRLIEHFKHPRKQTFLFSYLESLFFKGFEGHIHYFNHRNENYDEFFQ